MIRSIKYDSIRKIIVLCYNFLPFSSFLLKHILINANVVNVLCFYKKKDWERTRLSEEITTLNVTVMQHHDLAPFLFCALFALRLFALRPFCSAPFFPAPFLLRPYIPHPFCHAQMSWIAILYHKVTLNWILANAIGNILIIARQTCYAW